MPIYVYPENYTPPDAPPPAQLTEVQRNWVKGRMQAYVTSNGPTGIGKVVHIAHDQLISQYNKHIQTDVLREIAFEIRDEWGYPGQEESP